MEILLLVSGRSGEPTPVLPALDLLPHTVRAAVHDVGTPMPDPGPQIVLVDARNDISEARATCRMLYATGLGVPMLAVTSESSLIAVSADWGVDDVILTSAGPTEIDARLRLAVGRLDPTASTAGNLIRAGALTIDPVTYAAKVKGRPLDLTFKEYELLKFLAQQPGRVFTRNQLLNDVWGYDYFGGSRTVDVHIRRLRAKLGLDHESMIGTVRQVGYKLIVPTPQPLPDPTPAPAPGTRTNAGLAGLVADERS